ncbi:MAG: three-Cys-motif partner protein TcmP [Bacteroidota bacterium]
MAKNDVKKTMFGHSEAKVKLLGSYLKRYLNIIANDGYTNKIHLYDLFCGEGIYDNGGEGSPLIILKEIKNLHYVNVAKNNQIPSLNLYFNDLSEKKISKLEGIIEQKKLMLPEYGTLSYTSQDYKKLIDPIASKIERFKKEKAFIFIDPYGYKEIRASEIKKLMRAKKSEVLLFLPTQFMYRFDENGTPESLVELLDELVDYRGWQKTTSVFQFISQMKNGFRKHLGREFFVDTFTLERDPSSIFCLFFFSSHIRGFEKMLETKWELDHEQGRGFRFEATIDLFTTQKTNPLAEKLSAFLAKPKDNSQVYEFVLQNGFLPKHANEIFKVWQRDGMLNVQLANGVKARKSSFYISYDHFKNEPQKVTFTKR